MAGGLIYIDWVQDVDLTANIMVAPDTAYVIGLSMPHMLGGSTNVIFEFAANFVWDESDG